MKRYLALFTATIILIANCIVYTPVKAVGTSVDFAEMFSEYLSLAEMSMALTQGVEIDFSNFEFDENATNQEKAKALLNYYYGLLYNGLDFFLDLSGNQDVISEQMAAIALQTSGNLSSTNIQDLRSQVSSALQNYAVTGNWNIPIMQHYDDLCIANWNKYNSMFINDYLNNVNYFESNSVVPTPDDDFVNIITYINDTGFTIKDYNQFAEDSTYNHYREWPLSLFTWTSDDSFSEYWNCNSKLTINISGSDDNYTFICVTDPQYIIHWSGSDWRNKGYIQRSAYVNNNRYYLGGSSNVAQKTYTKTGSLSTVFSYIQSHFRNVNIYVNGTPWALPGYVIDQPGMTFSNPNAVIDNSTDDGKIVSNPIYYPDAISQDGHINIDLDAVRDTIIDAIAQGRTSINIDDVVDAGAVVKVDGTTLTDADTKTLDASIPIEAAKADTLVVPVTAVPGLPKLPPIIPPGDTGGNILPNGFSGMSVLARIINITVQSVPEPLIMCFFGVIFGMVVLGIIKILHH